MEEVPFNTETFSMIRGFAQRCAVQKCKFNFNTEARMLRLQVAGICPAMAWFVLHV